MFVEVAVHIALCFVVAFLEPRLSAFENVDINLHSETLPPSHCAMIYKGTW
jgi:hypothetical protein